MPCQLSSLYSMATLNLSDGIATVVELDCPATKRTSKDLTMLTQKGSSNQRLRAANSVCKSLGVSYM